MWVLAHSPPVGYFWACGISTFCSHGVFSGLGVLAHFELVTFCTSLYVLNSLEYFFHIYFEISCLKNLISKTILSVKIFPNFQIVYIKVLLSKS